MHPQLFLDPICHKSIIFLFSDHTMYIKLALSMAKSLSYSLFTPSFTYPSACTAFTWPRAQLVHHLPLLGPHHTPNFSILFSHLPSPTCTTHSTSLAPCATRSSPSSSRTTPHTSSRPHPRKSRLRQSLRKSRMREVREGRSRRRMVMAAMTMMNR